MTRVRDHTIHCNARTQIFTNLRCNMENYVTGSTEPSTCVALSEATPPADAAYVCFGGLWCDENGQNCTDLRNCGINGRKRCNIFQSPKLVEGSSFTKGSSIQLVYRCVTDWSRVVAFTLGTVCSILFLATLGWRMGFFFQGGPPAKLVAPAGALGDAPAAVLAPAEA